MCLLFFVVQAVSRELCFQLLHVLRRSLQIGGCLRSSGRTRTGHLADNRRLSHSVSEQLAVGPFSGRCTTHFGTYFSGDWDVDWGYGLLTYGPSLRCFHMRGLCRGELCQKPAGTPAERGRAGEGKGAGPAKYQARRTSSSFCIQIRSYDLKAPTRTLDLFSQAFVQEIWVKNIFVCCKYVFAQMMRGIRSFIPLYSTQSVCRVGVNGWHQLAAPTATVSLPHLFLSVCDMARLTIY